MVAAVFLNSTALTPLLRRLQFRSLKGLTRKSVCLWCPKVISSTTGLTRYGRNAKYGDAPIDLAEYAPEGVTFTYETSNDEVARLDGSVLTIVGAGEATIGASYEYKTSNGIVVPWEIFGDEKDL